MFCPNCFKKQYFVCTNDECVCHKDIPEGVKTQVWKEDDSLACPYCGFTESLDYWEERYMESFRKRRSMRSEE